MPPPTPAWHPCRDAPAILTVGALPVIARLERILNVDLWGQEHRNPPSPQAPAASTDT